MKKKTAIVLLVLIVLLAFSSRLFFSFQTETVSYDAYFSLRQIESINDNLLPQFNDKLSFGGRTHLFTPLFYYLMALLDFIPAYEKVIPALLFALSVIPVYLISFQFTKKRDISLMAAFFSSFIPVAFSLVNDVSVYSLLLLITLFTIYFVSRINEEKYLYLSIGSLVLLVLAHSSSFLVLLGFLIYLLLIKLESLEQNSKEQELILFGTFLALWYNFIVYKDAFLVNGPLLIWQNIPLQILTNFYFDFNIIQSIYFIGIIPVFFGIYGLYNTTFFSKKRPVLMIVAFFLSSLLLLWVKLIPFRIGLLFMSFMLVLLSAYSLHLFYSYIKKTKFDYIVNWVLVGILLLFFLTAIFPSITIASKAIKLTPSKAEVDAMLWLKNNTANDSVVMARPEEGNLITYFAKRKNVIDNDYLMVKDAQQRYDDVSDVYNLRLKTEVVRILNKYNVNYLYFSKKFGTQDKLYYLDEPCFNLVYDKVVQIYQVGCKLE